MYGCLHIYIFIHRCLCFVFVSFCCFAGTVCVFAGARLQRSFIKHIFSVHQDELNRFILAKQKRLPAQEKG